MSFALLVTCAVSAWEVISLSASRCKPQSCNAGDASRKIVIVIARRMRLLFPSISCPTENIESHCDAVESLSHPFTRVPSFATQSRRHNTVVLLSTEGRSFNRSRSNRNSNSNSNSSSITTVFSDTQSTHKYGKEEQEERKDSATIIPRYCDTVRWLALCVERVSKQNREWKRNHSVLAASFKGGCHLGSRSKGRWHGQGGHASVWLRKTIEELGKKACQENIGSYEWVDHRVMPSAARRCQKDYKRMFGHLFISSED